MVIEADHNITVYYNELDVLLRRNFEDLQNDTFSPADYRSIIQLDNTRIISHAALQKRSFDFIGDPQVDTYLLGYVCTEPGFRNQGYSRKCLEEIIGILGNDRWIVVLNCKDHMVSYYRKFGFEVIPGRACYSRNGMYEEDGDPVMALCCPEEFRQLIQPKDVLFLGEDF